MIQHDRPKHQQAIQEYDKAIQIDPDDALYYNNRGLAYRHLGQDQRASQDFDKAC